MLSDTSMVQLTKIRVKAIFIGLFVCSATTVEARQIQGAGLDFSCSVFPESLSETALIARYGAENVTRAPVFGVDDGPVNGTVLFPNLDERVEIAWQDTESMRQPAWIRVRGEQIRWRTPHGIRIGDDLVGIERRNGWPFRLGGFSLEGGQGSLRSWGGRGRFKDVDLGVCALIITFQPRPGSGASQSTRQILHGEFSSGHPAMQALNPTVVAIWIRYGNR